MAINPSTVFTKYLVNKRSPILFSCGIILSIIEMTLVCLFFLAIFNIVPKQGARNGIQNRTIIKSGFSRYSLSPILIQLKGLIEFIQTSMFTLIGFGSVVY